jgi:hypothetical protein
MPSASVTARKTKRGGRRYAVRFRLGGRAYPVERGGSLRALAEQPQRQALTVRTWRDKFLASRLDIDANTTKNYRTALKKVSESFGERGFRRPALAPRAREDLRRERRGSSICPNGSCKRSTARAPWKTARPIARSSRASPRPRLTRR